MQREYWKKQLKDAPHVPHIPMPSDFDTPITDDSLGEEIKVTVPADLVRSLKSLAIACGTTLFVTVLGAWKVGPVSVVPLPVSASLRGSLCTLRTIITALRSLGHSTGCLADGPQH